MKNKDLGTVLIGIGSLLLLSSIGVEAKLSALELAGPGGIGLTGTGIKGATVTTIIVGVIFMAFGVYLRTK
jgi:hypothetical protein